MNTQNPHLLDAAQQSHVDTWANVYFHAHISELLDISLSRFLEAPQRYLKLAGQSTATVAIANGYCPLLPAQVAASQRIQRLWREQENSARVESDALPTTSPQD